MKIPEQGIQIKVQETEGITRERWPLSRGVPLPEGEVDGVEELWVEDGSENVLPAQFRVLGRWPDGSVKWVLVDWQADLDGGGETVYWLKHKHGVKAGRPQHKVQIAEGEDSVNVCTGALRFAIGKKAFALFDGVEIGAERQGKFVVETEVAPHGGGDAWAKISEAEFAGGTTRRVYGMGGECLALRRSAPVKRSGAGRGVRARTAAAREEAVYSPEEQWWQEKNEVGVIRM